MLNYISIIIIAIQVNFLFAQKSDTLNILNPENTSTPHRFGVGAAYSEKNNFKLRTKILNGKWLFNFDLGYYPKDYNVDSLKKGTYPGAFTTPQKGIVTPITGKNDLITKSETYSFMTNLSYIVLGFDDFELQLFLGGKLSYLSKTVCENSYEGYQRFTDNQNFIPADYIIEKVNNTADNNSRLSISPYCGAGVYYKLLDNVEIGAELPIVGDGESFVFSVVYMW